jgi:FixJ family two-component response regulator
MQAQSWVAVIDDDASMRRALTRWLHINGIPAESFASVEAYHGQATDRKPRCVVLDVTLGGRSGGSLEVGDDAPVILMTGHEEVRTAPGNGMIVDCLLKPFDPATLLERVLACWPRESGGART